jgi:hypothetical protein
MISVLTKIVATVVKVAGLTLFLAGAAFIALSVASARRDRDQSFFELAASLANRSAFSRAKFLRSAICSFSYSVSGLSDGRNVSLALFSRLLTT